MLPIDAKDLSFLGGALSTLIAALSYWAKTRHERRRATRTALYYLLELHYLAHRRRRAGDDVPAKVVDQMTAALKRRGISVQPVELATVEKQATIAIQSSMAEEVREALLSFKEPLEKVLSELAREDPVLAFRIRGRDSAMLLFDKVSESATATLTPSDQAIPVFNRFLGGAALRGLRDAIYSAALACDVITLAKVHWTMRKQLRDAPVENDEIDRFIEEMLQTMQASSPPR
jgi:transcriptional regulator NrdR family protein